MPKRYLTKFDDGGQQCKNDINYLKKHPECGIPFIQDRPFNPVNPIPIHKFSQINRDFPINQMDRQVPRTPRHVAPQQPLVGNKVRGTIDADPYSVYLPQDQTNDNFIRRLDFKDDEHLVRMQDRGYYQRIGNDAYAHQDLLPSFEESQPIGAVREPYVVGGDVPLEDFGAGRGINTSTNFQALPRGDPRTAEEFAPTLSDLPEDILNEIQNFARRPTDILDLPQNIRQRIIEMNDGDIVPEEVPIDMEEINLEIQRLGRLLPVYERTFRTGASEAMRESAAGSINRVTNQIESLTNLQQRLQNFINVRRGAEEALEIGRPPRQRGIQEPKIPRPRGANPQEIELQELQNLTRNSTQAQTSRIRRVMFPDVPEDAPTRRGKGKKPPRIQKPKKIIIVNANDLPGELARELINQGFANRETGEINLNDIRDKIINLQNDSNILSGEPRENVERQIVELQDLLKEANKFVQPELIQERLPPPDAPPSPPEEQMFPIEEIDEYKIALEEVKKIMKPNQTDLTEAQKEIIIKNMERRGVSRQRTIEILTEAEVYDPAMERALGGKTRTKAEALARAIRGGFQHHHNDSNLRAEAFEIDITPETPMLSREEGRGRTRLQKEIQRRAGQLPEELRQGFKSVSRSATEFSEAISSRSAEALQNIRATSTRMFGRQYAQISTTDFDSARNAFSVDEFQDITPRTQDITGLRVNDIANVEGLAPLEEAVLTRAGRPQLTFAENLAAVRRGAFSREAGVAGAGAIAGAGAGYGIGILSNEAMRKLGIKQNMATQTLTGGIAGAGGDVVARVTSMASASALERAGISTAAETLSSAAARGFGRAIARGAAEGGVIGIALTPVDLVANSLLFSATKSHAVSNVISTTGIGVAATGLAAWLAGATAATETGSVAAAPETGGISLIPGAIATGIFATIGWFVGADQDKKEKEAREKIANIKEVSFARTELIKSLPKYNYNIDEAINNYPNKANLGIDDDSWDFFKSNLNTIFNDKPPHEPKGATAETTEEQEKINRLFSQQITHYTIKEVCKKGGCSQEMLARDKGALNKKDYDWLNEKMAGTLMQQENLQIQLNIQTLQYTQKRIKDSQEQMLDSWNKDQKLITDPNVLAFAYTDPTWKQRFDTYAKLNAQYLIINAYQTNQTTYDNMPKDIRTMANLDPEFESTMRQYYTDMATTARDMNITIPQLVQIQGTPQNEQTRVYEGIQFDNIKQDPNVVSDAERIAKEEDAVRNGAIQFYDIDQAYILSDPTNITTWKPSDAQILQAYNAGMTLREYTDYMHELAKGKDGDFSRLPVYTQEQIKQFTDDDVAHFQDELKMTGHEGLYTWDEQNRTWILHNSNNNVLSSQHYQSPFIPGRLLKARQEYADMIHGLNEQNQQSVDTFNNNLMKDLTSYGRHYDSIVASINDQREREGRTDLLFYDVHKIYEKNKIEFTPMSDVMGTPLKPIVSSQAETSGRQLAQQTEIEKPIKEQYNLSRQQYTDVKRNIESKNIKNPNIQQVEQAVQEVKDAGVNQALAS